MKNLSTIFFILVTFQASSSQNLKNKHLETLKNKKIKIAHNISKKFITNKRDGTSSTFNVGRQALKFTNQFRVQNGRPRLTWNQTMANLARNHSKRMATGKTPFGHSGFSNRVSRFGFTVRAAGENVFAGSVTNNVARVAVNAWINSPSHRQNLLGNYNLCGIGAFQNARGVWYLTQEFALR